MNMALRARIVTVWSEPGNEAMPLANVAKAVGVSVSTLRDYITPQVRADIDARRSGALTEDVVRDVDRAMVAKACAGNIMAARLVYARLAGQGGTQEALPSLEELEAELKQLKERGGG
jgi:hypothetical protein